LAWRVELTDPVLIAWRNAAGDGEDLADRHRLAVVAFLSAGGPEGGAREVVEAILNAGARECGEWLFALERHRLRRARRNGVLELHYPARGWPETFDGDPC
jgi:hypothetical protein